MKEVQGELVRANSGDAYPRSGLAEPEVTSMSQDKVMIHWWCARVPRQSEDAWPWGGVSGCLVTRQSEDVWGGVAAAPTL